MRTIMQNKDDTATEILRKVGIGREFFWHIKKLKQNELITIEKISVLRPRGKTRITQYNPTKKCLKLQEYLKSFGTGEKVK